MRFQLAIDAGLLLLAESVFAYPHVKRDLPALDTNPQNSISNRGGPILYYNGSGDVPRYDETTPAPSPITPLPGRSPTNEDYPGKLAAILSATSSSRCDKCTQTVQLLRRAAVSERVPTVVDLLIRWCELVGDAFELNAASCYSQFAATPRNQSERGEFSSGASQMGDYMVQVFAKMQSDADVSTFCFYYRKLCPAPAPIQIDESKYFKPKPPSAQVAPVPSGRTFDVLHITDWHLDPRPYRFNEQTGLGTISQAASRYGSLKCDTPADLAISTFTTMDQFFDRSKVEFAIFTGDILSHDENDQLSQEYVEWEERVTYDTFKAHMGDTPVYATLGNHDSFPEAFASPNSLRSGNSFSWNYELHSSLWENNGWINRDDRDYARTHYGVYAHTTKQGLRMISINSDFWYRGNHYNFYDTANPDNSGVLAFLADELTACENRGQRVWIIAHVPTGYDGSQALPNPSALFHSIVNRFSPATIAAVFFGHTHEDQLQIFYDFAGNSLNNGLRDTRLLDSSKPLQMGFIGPSVAPLPGLNAGYQRLQVDSKTFSVMGVQTYIANISQSLEWTTPEWKFEYDARETYNIGGVNWPNTSPLNATFYDKVTAEMAGSLELVNKYIRLGTKSVINAWSCPDAICQQRIVCLIKSGSTAAGQACG
ncbi:MAG: hypothetical protein M1831_001425 [Alyxoria varia]|nr:MAG: hypothetical protein M1831_001425 [Alyxoria varia]